MHGFRLVCSICAAVWVVASCSPPPQPVGYATDVESAATEGIFGDENMEAESSGGLTSAPGRLTFGAEAGDDGGDGGDRIRLALTRPDSTRPADLNFADRSAVVVSDLLYDGLTTFDVDHGVVQPGLARRWRGDDDFDRWEFELAGDREVGADDVARTFADLRNSSHPLVALTAANVAAVTGNGDELVIELDHPDPDFPTAVSGVAFSIVGVRSDGSAGLPTGRFSVISDDSNGMVLRSHSGDRNRMGAEISEVLISWVDDVEDGYDQLTLGLVDATVVDHREIDDARSRYAETFPVINTTRFLMVNPRSSALATVSARLALAAAVNVGDLVATGTEAATWVRRDRIRPGPYGGAAERDIDGDPCSGNGGCDGVESDAARSLVRRTVTVGFSDESGEDLAQRVTTDLRSTGWVADLSAVPAGLSAGAADSDVDVVIVDQAWPWPTAGHALTALLGPGRFLADVDVDGEPAAESLAAALSGDNPVERAAALASLEDKLVESGWLIPIAGRRSTLARSPLIQQLGLTFDGSLNVDH